MIKMPFLFFCGNFNTPQLKLQGVKTWSNLCALTYYKSTFMSILLCLIITDSLCECEGSGCFALRRLVLQCMYFCTNTLVIDQQSKSVS